jgi:AcrR family transcriptional regulator
MDAAAALFVEKGVDATTVDDIVLRADMAKGAFYHHYESKAALLDVLREQVTADFEKRIDVALAKCPPDDLWRVLDTWIEAACDSYLKMDPLHDVVFGSAPLRWTIADEKSFQDLAALLRKGQAQGVWRVDDPHLTAIFIFRGLLGAVDDRVLSGKRPTTAARVIAELIRKAIALE